MNTQPASPNRSGNLHRLRLLATDTLVYGVAAAISKSFALILFPFLTHNLSVADYGRFDLALYATQLFGLVVVWGQDSAVARLFFEDDTFSTRQQIISQALLTMTANFMLSVVGLFILLQTAFIWRAFGEKTPELIFLLFLYAPISGLLSFCQGLLKWTFDRNRYIAVALGVPASNLVLILLFARLHRLTVAGALSIMVGVAGLFACVGIFFIRRWIAVPRGTEYVRKLIPLAIPYGLIACISALSPLLERAVVSGSFGAYDLGLYAAAAKLASIVMMLSIAFQMGWGPFSYSIYKQPDAARTYSLVLRAFALIMCLTVLAVTAFSETLAALFAGARYKRAALYVFPIAMSFGVQAIGWITEIGIHLSKKTYLNLFGFGLFVAISLAGMLYLSHIVGILGVALGTLLGQIAMLATSAIIAQRAFRLDWAYGVPTVTVVATLATGGAALSSAYFAPGVPRWSIYLAGMVLVVALNLSFGISTDDRRRIGAFIQRCSRQARDA